MFLKQNSQSQIVRYVTQIKNTTQINHMSAQNQGYRYIYNRITHICMTALTQ